MNRRMMLAAVTLLPVAAIAAAMAAEEPTTAQPELSKQSLTIITRDGARHEFHVEIATTPREQEIGLMFRPTVAPDGGMLFDWGGVRDNTMWMRNTIAPLDMLFINSDGTIHHIAENTVPQSLAMIPSGGAVRATLEVAAGTAARLHLRVGDRIEGAVFNKVG